MNHQKEKQINRGDRDFGGRIAIHNQTRGYSAGSARQFWLYGRHHHLSLWGDPSLRRGGGAEPWKKEDEHGASSIAHKNRSKKPAHNCSSRAPLHTHTAERRHTPSKNQPPSQSTAEANTPQINKSTATSRKNRVNGDTKYTGVDPQRIQPGNRHVSTARHTDDPNHRRQQ
jgi:hypothetical protein